MKPPHKPALASIEIYDKIDTTMSHPPPQLPGATIALTQHRGRGRTGAWHSPPGGAWLTIHTPQPPPSPALGVATGGCLAARLNKLLPAPQLLVKWPNDIYTPRGLKTAGILIEATQSATRIGIGINVYNKPPPGAANLQELGYHGPLTQVYVAAIEAALEALTDTQSCLQEAARHDYLRGKQVTIETPSGTITGTAEGIDTATGALLLQAKGKLHKLTCCHITRVTPPPQA